ncbi:c-di-GMP-binding flagellar brake protein YcgR, contains PilZNR and PilZ domains [Thiohalospira halophila DSM 15071]|uniref:C-di-GMP-binding flagellar brake protein YcgR, contains PilZNR and PilZ domains n=1 Tax=Thiohalospira halophila DSM 15071 TaxID=1123397 RepID=A0A1I1WGP2_9GAMM|nr:flagellar brake protein [Thiohalospira halophila]SFD92250.1 c-di-GMP-binding flagellar brake protein YcgR, contains PilZNR and PilZ domains [Thiohalospira halophila DSM 15071]
MGSLADNDNHITRPHQIVGILRRLADGRHIVNVSTPFGGNQIHTSAILDVNAERGYLLLDELNPPPSTYDGLTERRVGIFAQLGGVDVSFSTTVSRVGREDGTPWLLLALPEHLLYQQRREHFRAAASSADPIPVRLGLEGREGPMIQGELADISIGGLGVRMDSRVQIPEDFGHGTLIPYAAVDVPGQSRPLECKLEVRAVREDTDNRRRQIGLRFIDLDPRSERQVEKLVFAMDREQRRRGT